MISRTREMKQLPKPEQGQTHTPQILNENRLETKQDDIQ
jgi:hypothetical protein